MTDASATGTLPSRWVALEERDNPWNILGETSGMLGAGRKAGDGGRTIESAMTAAEVLAATGLTMLIKKYPVHIDLSPGHDGSTMLRSQKYFMTGYEADDGDIVQYGPVSDVYEITQPSVALEIFDEVIKAHDGAHYTAGWNLPEKCRMGVTIRLPETFRVGDDELHAHMLGINSFDGGTALWGLPVWERIACRNQVPNLIRGARAAGFRFKHTKNVNTKAKDARELLSNTYAYFKDWEKIGGKLVTTAMTYRDFTKFLGKVTPFQHKEVETDLQKERVEQRINDAVAAWGAEHNANITGTAWGALNVVTEFAQWGREVKGSNRTGASATRQRAIGTMVHPDIEKWGRQALEALGVKVR